MRYAAILLAAVAIAGCSDDTAIDETATSSNTNSSTSAGGAGGSTSSSGGDAQGGGAVCTPGETLPCYEGPSGTEDVGVCSAGSATCLPDGSGIGSCEGQLLPSVEICATTADEDCDGSAAACTGASQWEALITSSDNSNQFVHGIAVGSSGVYVGGRMDGIADFEGTPLDAGMAFGSWLAKVDFNGTPIWSKLITSTNVAHISGIVVDDQERVTVVGSFQDDIDAGAGSVQGASNWDVFVASYEGSSGNLRYLNTFATSSWQVARSIAARPDGTVAITGDFYGTVNFGGNQLTAGTLFDMFVAVFDATGAHVWSKRFGDGLSQAGQKVHFAPDGHLLVSGNNNGTIDFGGMPHTSAGLTDIVIAKLDGGSGARIWSALYGDSGAQNGPNTVAVGSDGSVVLATYSTILTPTTVDFGAGAVTGYFFVVKHDAAGNVIWSKGYDALRGVIDLAVDFVGDVVITGSLEGTIDFGDGPVTSFGNDYDAFVVKLAGSDGNARWTQLFGDTNQQSQHQRGFAIALSSTGDVYAGGSWRGATDFGFGEHISGAGFGGDDGWLLRLAP